MEHKILCFLSNAPLLVMVILKFFVIFFLLYPYSVLGYKSVLQYKRVIRGSYDCI